MLVRWEPRMLMPALPVFDDLFAIEPDPFREMKGFPEIESELDEFAPDFDLKETADEFVLKADVPGIAEKDIDLSLTGNRLTVSGKREEEKEEKGDVRYTWERSYGAFSRTFTLPEGADLTQVKAELKDGVLTITTPKKPVLQPHKVPITPMIAAKEPEKEPEKKA